MNSLTILLLITVESLKSDWVEIKQVSNQKLYEGNLDFCLNYLHN